MYTKLLGCSLGLFLTSTPLFASPGAERSGEENALPAVRGYSVEAWAKGTAEFNNPDSIDFDRGHVWVGYQNVTSKSGGDGKSSTVVEYNSDGRLLRKFAVPGLAMVCGSIRLLTGFGPLRMKTSIPASFPLTRHRARSPPIRSTRPSTVAGSTIWRS
ncbi:MAG: hypothetical protein M3O31_00975 [Acidobacteriota bacterium]|nr:hypothetical protein [Acidobacteriota bacterium]